MDSNEYIAQRLEPAREWYSRNSRSSKSWHNILQVSQILAAACIPFLPSVIKEISALNTTTGALGVLIAVMAGISALYKFDERWTSYRSASESLKNEKFLYLTQVGPYGGTDPFSLLVRRVENLISQENRDWSEYLGSVSKKEGVASATKRVG